MSRYLGPGQPPFPAETYKRWLERGAGTEDQQMRYQTCLEWYGERGMKLEIEGNGSKPRGKLAEILAELMTLAEQTPGTPARRDLAGGLRVDILLKKGETRLQLSRPGISPSMTEWNTIMKNLPITMYVSPKETKHDGRCYLVGAWKITEK